MKAPFLVSAGRPQVLGPIIVDTTPPVFVEEIIVFPLGDYLTARWLATEIEDTGLAFQVAVGKAPSVISS